MSAPRPTPVADDLSAPFWNALAAERFVVQRCRSCHRFHHPPTGMCWSCLSTDLSFEEVSGRARVVAYTIVHEARHAAFRDASPYVVAAVRLDEQDDLYFFTNLPNVAPGDVVVGMPVTIVFDPLDPDHVIPQFTATKEL